MHTIKPIDKNMILEASKTKLIFTVEEHNIIGGLGSAVAECVTQLKHSPRQIFIGIKDHYDKGGEYNFLKEKHGLSAEKIVENVQFNYNNHDLKQK